MLGKASKLDERAVFYQFSACLRPFWQIMYINNNIDCVLVICDAYRTIFSLQKPIEVLFGPSIMPGLLEKHQN